MKKLVLLMAAALIAFTGSSQATIIGGSVTLGNGNFVELTPGFMESTPNNIIGAGSFQTLNLYAFNEDQNTTVLNNPLNVDILASTGSAGTLSVGTIVKPLCVF